MGAEPVIAHNEPEALAQVDRVRLVFLDLCLAASCGERTGLALITKLRQRRPDVSIVIVTGHFGYNDILEALRLGADDYLVKCAPHDLDRKHHFEGASIARVLEKYCPAAGPIETNGALLGTSPAMIELKEEIAVAAEMNEPVLVRGERGTGKNVVARAIHDGGPRRAKPFVAFNAAAIAESLLESTLFGHVEGSFTGATAKHDGLFAEADGGTLFMDEVGDLPKNLQAKLLRVVEERKLRPLGGRERSLDVRLICATNVDLELGVAQGTFRADLLDRLNVLRIGVPSLAARGREDFDLLLEAFIARSTPRLILTEEARAALSELEWPGNVRSLASAVVHLTFLQKKGRKSQMDRSDVDAAMRSRGGPKPIVARVAGEECRRIGLAAFEARVALSAVDECEGNVSKAARQLGVSRKTVMRLVRSAKTG